MKLSGSMTMKYSIHMLKYIIHMCMMCDYEVLPPAGTAMRKRDFEDLPPAGTNSRTSVSVRKASPSSGSFTLAFSAAAQRRIFQCTIEKLNYTDSGYDTEFSFGSILTEFSKVVDLGEPTSFLDHVYLRCTQRQCEIIKDIVDNYRTMFESRTSAGGTEKLQGSEIFSVFLRGPTIWRGMPIIVWNDIVSWQTGQLNNSTKYQLHALTTITSKKKD